MKAGETTFQDDNKAAMSGNTDPDLFGVLYDDNAVHCFQGSCFNQTGYIALFAPLAPLLKDAKLYTTNVYSPPPGGFIHLDTVWTAQDLDDSKVNLPGTCLGAISDAGKATLDNMRFEALYQQPVG
jgi:hypothetical protein